MELNEIKHQDDYFLNGLYWVVADSFSDILAGKFKIIGTKYFVDYDGNEIGTDKKYLTHKEAWEELGKDYPGRDCRYFPHGRVNLYKGKLFINTNSKVTNGNIIGDVLDFYELDFDPEIVCNDSQKGNKHHYSFELE